MIRMTMKTTRTKNTMHRAISSPVSVAKLSLRLDLLSESGLLSPYPLLSTAASVNELENTNERVLKSSLFVLLFEREKEDDENDERGCDDEWELVG